MIRSSLADDFALSSHRIAVGFGTSILTFFFQLPSSEQFSQEDSQQSGMSHLLFVSSDHHQTYFGLGKDDVR